MLQPERIFLFGIAVTAIQYFTQSSYDNSTTNVALAVKGIIKMMNPMYYIDLGKANVTQNWCIRHGRSR